MHTCKSERAHPSPIIFLDNNIANNRTVMMMTKVMTKVMITKRNERMKPKSHNLNITSSRRYRKLLKYKNLQIQPQDIASLVVMQQFGPHQKELLHSQNFFSRSESTCVLTFKSEREAQAHMDSGKHIKELKSVSLYDTIRLRWAERVMGISNVAQEASAVFAHEKSASLKTKASSMGWALKVVVDQIFTP